jgi:hypothetical protein
MTSGFLRGPRLRAAPPWIVLGVALAAATAPVWRLAVFGFDPALDDLLGLVCSPEP